MKVLFKYQNGDTVTLIKKPSNENMKYGKRYLFDDEFTPKQYKIEMCKCVISSTNEPKVLYNLYTNYDDEYLTFHNWIPDDCLEGEIHEHEEDIEFISHDKEVLSVGDIVLADVFSGSYDDPYMMPSLTFGYVGEICKLEYEIMSTGKPIRTAIIEYEGNLRTEFTPYLVKNMDRNFAMEYVKHCKKNRFNPLTSEFNGKYMALLKGINVWDDVAEIYNNWNKYRKSSSTTAKKKVKKETKKKEDVKKDEEFISKSKIKAKIKEMYDEINNNPNSYTLDYMIGANAVLIGIDTFIDDVYNQINP